jgi:hypothetical protein
MVTASPNRNELIASLFYCAVVDERGRKGVHGSHEIQRGNPRENDEANTARPRYDLIIPAGIMSLGRCKLNDINPTDSDIEHGQHHS